MISGNVRSRKNGPGIAQIQAAIDKISKMDVLVGIPAEKTRRDDGPVTNAALLYIHTNGSVLQGIPARPVIEPALNAEDNKQTIHKYMASASKAVLKGDMPLAIDRLKRLGMKAASIVKAWFVDPRNNWAPNSPATIAYKEGKMSAKQKQIAIARGGPLTRPLIDTGEMRKSITYVVRGAK